MMLTDLNSLVLGGFGKLDKPGHHSRSGRAGKPAGLRVDAPLTEGASVRRHGDAFGPAFVGAERGGGCGRLGERHEALAAGSWARAPMSLGRRNLIGSGGIVCHLDFW